MPECKHVQCINSTSGRFKICKKCYEAGRKDKREIKCDNCDTYDGYNFVNVEACGDHVTCAGCNSLYKIEDTRIGQYCDECNTEFDENNSQYRWY